MRDAVSDRLVCSGFIPVLMIFSLVACSESVIEAQFNTSPTVSGVNITGDSAVVDDVLTGSYDYADVEGDVEGVSTFRWLRDGVVIDDATSIDYTLVSADVPAQIIFEVTPVAATGKRTGNAVTSSGIYTGTFGRSLNDTGITGCGDYAYNDTGIYSVTGSGSHDIGLDCTVQPVIVTRDEDGQDNDGDIVPVGQDALYGRDDTNNDSSDGYAGFSFTKLDADGEALSDQTQTYAANPWACVKDNVTGLIWEVKTSSNRQKSSYTYTWYKSTGINTGGYAGATDGINTDGSDACLDTTRCDTEKYVSDINAGNSGAGLCGATDWRLPSKHELTSIVNNSKVGPSIDAAYFPNTQSSYYWSSSPYAGGKFFAWFVSFYDGYAGLNNKNDSRYIRLVRTGQ